MKSVQQPVSFSRFVSLTTSTHFLPRLLTPFTSDTIGGLTSPWIAGPITDRFGRRGGMFIGALIIIVGKDLSPPWLSVH